MSASGKEAVAFHQAINAWRFNWDSPVVDNEISHLEKRFGRLHVRQRLGIEKDHEAQVFGQGLNFFHVENSRLSALAIEYVLKLTGMFWRGQKNAERVDLRQNLVSTSKLPDAFHGFSILHLSDLHCDMSERAMQRVTKMVSSLSYDICVLTGDFRGQTYGPFEAALASFAQLRTAIRGAIYCVLGNHDSIRMVPRLETMGIRMLLNEADVVVRSGQSIHIAGIDDAHFYRADNIEKAAEGIPARRVFNLAFAYPRDLPAGRTCRLQLVAEWSYARGSDLPSWRHPDHPRFGATKTTWRRPVGA